MCGLDEASDHSCGLAGRRRARRRGAVESVASLADGLLVSAPAMAAPSADAEREKGVLSLPPEDIVEVSSGKSVVRLITYE